MGTIGIVLSMLAAVVLSGIIIRALPLAVPAPLVQIAMGAAIAALGDRPVQLDPEIFFLLFLPPLLFLDGWRIPKEGLLRDRGVILELALGLIVFTVLGMGLFIHWLIPALPLPVAFALAAIVSPTDPVAVSAINERAPMSRRLMHVLEGESLLNDASGLVCFRFAVAAALTGAFSLSAAALTFVQLAFGGVIVGTVFTYGVMLVKNVISRRIGEEAGSQVLISLLIPFGAYELAEHLGCSGILAAVAAGITMSYVELSGQAMARTRVQRAAVWDTMQFALNGVMFVLLGEQLPGILDGAVDAVQQSNHQSPWWLVVYVFAIWLGLTALRFAWVWVSIRRRQWIAARHGSKGDAAPPGWRLITAVSVAGVRGAITLAGVLTLPLALPDGTPFPGRELTIFLAASVIILSLILASITLPRLLRGMTPLAESAEQTEIDHARAASAEAAVHAIEQALYRMTRDHENTELYTEAAARVMDLYRRRIDGQTSGEDAARIRRSDDVERELRLAGLSAERDALFALARNNSLSDEASRRLVREIDLLEERLR
ncbi:MAG TPA: Na+/H+ antiporter [Povalibacter sp.]|nr:Na+/H+ antiporter [Povalibacter sp.]